MGLMLQKLQIMQRVEYLLFSFPAAPMNRIFDNGITAGEALILQDLQYLLGVVLLPLADVFVSLNDLPDPGYVRPDFSLPGRFGLAIARRRGVIENLLKRCPVQKFLCEKLV